MKKPKSWLPPGGENKFQKIKEKTKKAEESGVKIKKLSIGQPFGPALLSARLATAEAVMSDKESMHEYQDNGSPGVPGFAEKFVGYHVSSDLKIYPQVAFLPTPGTKPMFPAIIAACNLDAATDLVGTHTAPGYPTPADASALLRIPGYALRTDPLNEFRFSKKDIRKGTKLLLVNFPQNPTGQIATREFWMALCSYCQNKGIRLVNDAAYSALAYSRDHCTLTDVAVNYPYLSWLELFSSSKLIGNGTGWRVGAMTGSWDFISDVAKIKGNVDSGFCAPMAAGVLAAIQTDEEGILKNKYLYEERLACLIDILGNRGMRIAVMPQAGFFTLWKAPKTAFGERIADGEHFNDLMIEKTGVVGVPFGEYIRYAVTGDIFSWEEEISQAFELANVKY